MRDAMVAVPGPAQPAGRTSPYLGRVAAALMTAVGGAAIALNVDQSSAPFVRILVVAFLMAQPAIAISGLLPSVNPALALIVGLAGAAVINALVAQSMLSANAWSPRGGVVAVGLIAALLWLVPTAHPLHNEEILK